MMVSPVSVLLLVAVTALVGKAEVNVPSIDIYDQELRHNESMQLLDLLRGKESKSCVKLAGKCTKKKDCDGKVKYYKNGCSSKYKYVCCIPKSVDTMCKWKMDGVWYPANPPIIVNKENSNKIILPELDKDGKRILRVQESKDWNLIISCPGEDNTFEDNKLQQMVSIEANCIPGKVPRLQTKDDKKYTLYNLRCSSKVRSTVIEVKDKDDQDAEVVIKKCSGGNGVQLKIGFQIPSLEFNSMIDVCFQTTDQTTLWTEHTIYGDHIATKPDNGRPSWISDYEYFDVCVDRIYNAKEQFKFDQKTFNEHFIRRYTSENKYFARGHLSAKGDFTLEAESDATFHLINALPQWQRFNSAWGTVEQKIRDFAEKLHRDKTDNNLRIITGGFGKINLKDKNNADVDFWLGAIDNNRQKVPIPAVIWKVVISNKLNQSVAFLINNNPEVDKPQPQHLCAYHFACETLKWYNPGVGKIPIYCCLVDGLRNMGLNLPANIPKKLLIY